MHFRPVAKEKTNFTFTIQGENIDIVENYKYLGVLLNEHLDFNETTELLSSAAGRALGYHVS